MTDTLTKHDVVMAAITDAGFLGAFLQDEEYAELLKMVEDGQQLPPPVLHANLVAKVTEFQPYFGPGAI